MKLCSKKGEHLLPRKKRMVVPAVCVTAALVGVMAMTVIGKEEPVVLEEPEVIMEFPAVTVEPAVEIEEETIDPLELEMLAITIYREAGGNACSDETRIMVGNVVLNRMASDEFPDTMYDVLMAPRQFNTFCWEGIKWPEKARYEMDAVERAYDCARRALEGEKLLDDDVVWAAEFPQGTEIVVYQDGMYFCK